MITTIVSISIMCTCPGYIQFNLLFYLYHINKLGCFELKFSTYVTLHVLLIIDDINILRHVYVMFTNKICENLIVLMLKMLQRSKCFAFIGCVHKLNRP